MRLHEIIDTLNFREKNSFLKIINELIPVSANRREIDKILSNAEGDLKNLDGLLVGEVFKFLEEDFQEYLKTEFLEVSTQFDILIDIVIRDGNAIMNREWFYALYLKEIKKIKKKLKAFQEKLTSNASPRFRDYRIYHKCLSTAFYNDKDNNLDSKITNDELSILLCLANELELSQEEIRLINYTIIPLNQREVQEIIDDLKNKGVLFYSQKLSKVFVADELVRSIRGVRNKLIADKHFRRVLKSLTDTQINLTCKKHNIDWRVERDTKIKSIIEEGLNFKSVLEEDIFKIGTNLTERKKTINTIAQKLRIESFGGSTIEAKTDLLIRHFLDLESEEKLGISLDAYERLLVDLDSTVKSASKLLKQEFELSDEHVMSAKYLLGYNIKPRDVLDILSNQDLTNFCNSKNISVRGDEIANILGAYQDVESLYLENFANIASRDLNTLKENGVVIKEAELGLKFEQLTADILETLGFEVDEKLRKEVNTKKNQIDILVNLGDNNTMVIECKTSKDNYSKFSSVSRQIKSYKELVQAKGYSVIKTLLIAPNFTDDFVNDCRDDFELNLSLLEAKTLSRIVSAFKESGLNKINKNLFMRDVLIQEEIVLKGLRR